MWTGLMRKICITFFRFAVEKCRSARRTMLWHHFAIRLGLALVLGAFIGAERQWRQRILLAGPST
jgi:hypothetical protein